MSDELPYQNVRDADLLGPFIGARVVDITQQDEDEFKETHQSYLVASEKGMVACPGGCGAGYLPWIHPDGKWRLKCVVKPVYGDPERGDYVEGDEL